jgi:signal transduction histidine kinase
MVRESKRLQTLVEDFNQTVDLGDADLQEDLRAARGLLPAALTDSAIAVVSVDPPGADQTVAPAGRLLPVKGLGRSLTLTEQSLPELLDPLIAVTQAVAQEQQVDFRVAVEPTTPAVIADRQALQEVVANLLDNAVKYSPAQARVWVQTGLERRVSGKDYVGILVGDTGPGIPAEDRAQLFQRHYRGVQTTGPIGGTGLGLAIAKDLVTQMHGVIEVFSPAATTPGQGYPSHQEGPGTVFIVWLPKAG